ncbi:MAG: hypothetical protein M3P40_07230 [Actinomycetota bacterium]|nr:hypothetical protein [Actinomycetota bacterium]
MVAVIAGVLLALALFGSAVIKAVDFAGTRTALRTYGITDIASARVVAAALIAAEAGLALGVVAGNRLAAWATAALFAAFALGQFAALAMGRSGPCACFGARGRLGPASVTRAALLAMAAGAVAVLPRGALQTEQWLIIALGFVVVVLLGLAIVVLALAREIGTLKLALPAQVGALEVPHEGPEIGGHSELIDFFATPPGREQLGLAVFTSEGCAVCRALAPVTSAFARHPGVELATFDEVRDADAWRIADVPGSPYAVAFDPSGTTLAKGTFNSGAQLESVLAAAERRRMQVVG